MGNAESSYCKIPVKLLLKYNKSFPFDIFIKISVDKIIKISKENDEVTDLLKKYESKGIEEVYINKMEFALFLKQLKENFTNKFFGAGKPKTIDETLQLVEQGHAVVKEGFAKLGVHENVVEMAKEVTKQSVEMMKKVPNILEFYTQYKEKCAPAFMRGMLVGYTSSVMIEHFTWQSSVVKQKAVMAAQLCDLSLNIDEYQELLMWEKGEVETKKLEPNIFNHPTIVADMLSVESGGANLIAPEVINIIKQHHERPDGSGFPKGFSHAKITLLAAINIVAASFIELMIEHNFNLEKKDRILNMIQLKYNKGNFKKASEALQAMFT